MRIQPLEETGCVPCFVSFHVVPEDRKTPGAAGEHGRDALPACQRGWVGYSGIELHACGPRRCICRQEHPQRILERVTHAGRLGGTGPDWSGLRLPSCSGRSGASLSTRRGSPGSNEERRPTLSKSFHNIPPVIGAPRLTNSERVGPTQAFTSRLAHRSRT